MNRLIRRVIGYCLVAATMFGLALLVSKDAEQASLIVLLSATFMAFAWYVLFPVLDWCFDR